MQYDSEAPALIRMQCFSETHGRDLRPRFQETEGAVLYLGSLNAPLAVSKGTSMDAEVSVAVRRWSSVCGSSEEN